MPHWRFHIELLLIFDCYISFSLFIFDLNNVIGRQKFLKHLALKEKDEPKLSTVEIPLSFLSLKSAPPILGHRIANF